MDVISSHEFVRQQQLRQARLKARSETEGTSGPESPNQHPKSFEWNEVEDAFELSALVYCSKSTVEEKLGQWGYEKIQFISRWQSGTQLLLACKKRSVFLFFRGSESTLDWIIDLLCIFVSKPKRHLGFFLAWKSVREAIRSYLETYKGEYDQVRIGGHSLGGAVANVAAQELAASYPVHSVITFGAPLAFSASSAKTYDETKVADDRPDALGIRTIQVVNGRDIVTKLPPFLGFRGVGQLVYINLVQEITFFEEAIQARERDRAMDFDNLLDFLLPKEESFKLPASLAMGLSANSRGSDTKPRSKMDRIFSILRSALQFSPPLRVITLPLLLFGKYLQIVLYLTLSFSSHLLVTRYAGPVYSNTLRAQKSIPEPRYNFLTKDQWPVLVS